MPKSPWARAQIAHMVDQALRPGTGLPSVSYPQSLPGHTPGTGPTGANLTSLLSPLSSLLSPLSLHLLGTLFSACATAGRPAGGVRAPQRDIAAPLTPLPSDPCQGGMHLWSHQSQLVIFHFLYSDFRYYGNTIRGLPS